MARKTDPSLALIRESRQRGQLFLWKEGETLHQISIAARKTLHKCLENIIRIIWQWNKLETELTSLESPEIVKGEKVIGRNKFFSYNNKKWFFFPQDNESHFRKHCPNVRQTHEPLAVNALPSYFFSYLSFRSQVPKETIIKILFSWGWGVGIINCIFGMVNKTKDLHGSFNRVVGWSKNRTYVFGLWYLHINEDHVPLPVLGTKYLMLAWEWNKINTATKPYTWEIIFTLCWVSHILKQPISHL